MDKIKAMTPAQACIIGLVIAGLLYFFVFGGNGSLVKSMIPLKKQKIKLTKDIKDKGIIIQEAVEYQESIKKLGNTINKVVKYIPKNMSSTKMMRSLTDSAKVSGVNIIDVSDRGRAKGVESELYAQIPVSIKLEGNFTQIMMFLSNLTKLDNIITVEEFNIKSGNRMGEGIVAFSAVFVGYKYIDKQPVRN